MESTKIKLSKKDNETSTDIKESWIRKHTPKKALGLISNKKAMADLKKWLKDYPKYQEEAHQLLAKNEKKPRNSKNSPKSCLLVNGKHGTGKTITTKLVLKELGYETRFVSFEGIKNSKEVRELIKSLMNSSNVFDKISGKDSKKLAIVIDELEAITSPAGKSSITTLRKENDKKWYFPIIFISSNKHSKLLSDLRKTYTTIRFFPPADYIMSRILMMIVNAEKMGIPAKNKKIIDKIVDHAQSDIRRLIVTLEDLHELHGKTEIASDMLKEYFSCSRQKNVEFELFEVAKKLLYDDNSFDECLELYNTEIVLVPLMVLENFFKTVFHKATKLSMNNLQTLNMLQKVSEYLSNGDIVENIIYGGQNWDLKDVHCFLTCMATSNILYNEKVDVPEKSGGKEKFIFTNDLTRTSIRNINKKQNISNADSFFSNKTIHDYIYMNKIIRHYINNGKIKGCVDKILKDYPDISMTYVEPLLKIDKIRESKHSLSSKQKNEFTALLANS